MQDDAQLRETMSRDINIRNIRIVNEYEQDPKDPGKQRRVEKVLWDVYGDNNNVSTTKFAVNRLKPRNGRPGAIEWPAIEPVYNAWKAGQEAPIDGTPLSAWNGLDSNEIEYLQKSLSIRSVEQFANLNEGQIKSCQIMGARERVRRAKSFLEANEGKAEVHKALAERDATIEQQGAQLAEATETMQALADRIAELEANREEQPKRGPGRPRKAVEESAEA